MKKFSEFRDNLTAKQASNYSLIISIILTLIVAVFLTISIWPRYEGRAIILSILMSFMLFIAFYLLFSHFIFKAYDKIWAEKHKDAKQRVISEYKLTTATHTKVNYNFAAMIKDTSDKKMLVELLKIAEYNFYLKLTEDEAIELTVTDKYQHIIYTDTFKNFIYIEAYFQKIDE